MCTCSPPVSTSLITPLYINSPILPLLFVYLTQGVLCFPGQMMMNDCLLTFVLFALWSFEFSLIEVSFSLALDALGPVFISNFLLP